MTNTVLREPSELVERLPSKGMFLRDTIPEPLSEEERRWLVEQLHRWPERVNEARTCAIGALTDMATTEFCRLMVERLTPTPEPLQVEAVAREMAFHEDVNFIQQAFRNIEVPPLSADDMRDINGALVAFAREVIDEYCRRAILPTPEPSLREALIELLDAVDTLHETQSRIVVDPHAVAHARAALSASPAEPESRDDQ